MGFASPLWLWGLIAWGVLAAWLLWGRRPRRDVPFLALWSGAIEQRRPRRKIERPPISLLLVLASTLLALLAAAGPVVHGVGRGAALTVVLDRGLMMSAATNGRTRFAEAAAELAAKAPRARIHMIVVPGDYATDTDGAHLSQMADMLAPTAVHTDALVAQAAQRELATTTGPVILLTDNNLPFHDPRLVLFPPTGAIEDVGISAMAARATPRPQVMVRVLNQSRQTATTLRVESDGDATEMPLVLPHRGEERVYFVDVPKLGETIAASLDVHDDLPADDRAWLVRSSEWPAIEPRAPLSKADQRMIEVYARHRPPGAKAPRVIITNDVAPLAQEDRAIILSGAASVLRPSSPLVVKDHPITQYIDWQKMETVGVAPAPDGWDPLVTADGQAIVAVRTEPARQVWIGFDLDAWAAKPQFVIFWTNVLDWVGQGEELFTSEPVEDLNPPGIRVDESGGRHAANAFAERVAPSAAQKVDFVPDSAATGKPLSPVVAFGAVMAICLAAVAWPRAKRF
jgi:hypothetical protein